MKKVALIGIGGHAQAHYNALRTIEPEGQVELVAVADPFLDRMPELQAQLEADGIAMFPSDEILLATQSELDAVVISTPIPLHEAMLFRALNHPANPRILLEKPPLPTVAQMTRAIDADEARRVRVAFQMIFSPPIQFLKKILVSGEAGPVRRITISAGWPRADTYYSRSSWAGKMALDGEPVFDGPATNALAHLLHNGLFFCGKTHHEFGKPEEVRGEFYRARRIESYDMAWLSASVGDIEIQAALAHCVGEPLPFEIHVETDGATLVLKQSGELAGWPAPGFKAPAYPEEFLYNAFFAEDSEFDLLPTTLADALSFTELTEQALAASGGIHDIGSAHYCEKEGLVVVNKLAGYLSGFASSPTPPSEFFSWGVRAS